MRQHEFTVDLPHSARRLWALFQRYDLWKEYAPAVLDVEIVYPGDAEGNGLLRRVVYPLPFGRRGESFELVKNVRANQGYDYVMLRTGLSGSMTLEPLGSASRRRGPVLPGDALTLQQVCRAGFCRPRHAVGPVDRAARSLSVPGPRQGLGPTEVAPRIRAGGDDAEPLRARVGECRLREARRDLAPAQRGRREGVLQVEQIAAPLVDERRLRAVQPHDEAPRLVPDAHLHRPTLPAEPTRGKTVPRGSGRHPLPWGPPR